MESLQEPLLGFQRAHVKEDAVNDDQPEKNQKQIAKRLQILPASAASCMPRDRVALDEGDDEKAERHQHDRAEEKPDQAPGELRAVSLRNHGRAGSKAGARWMVYQVSGLVLSHLAREEVIERGADRRDGGQLPI